MLREAMSHMDIDRLGDMRSQCLQLRGSVHHARQLNPLMFLLHKCSFVVFGRLRWFLGERQHRGRNANLSVRCLLVGKVDTWLGGHGSDGRDHGGLWLHVHSFGFAPGAFHFVDFSWGRIYESMAGLNGDPNVWLFSISSSRSFHRVMHGAHWGPFGWGGASFELVC